MIIVDALTDNVNRTASDVRAAFGKNGGNMGVSGSVAYMFEYTAVFGIEDKSADDILEALMEQDIDVRQIFFYFFSEASVFPQPVHGTLPSSI